MGLVAFSRIDKGKNTGCNSRDSDMKTGIAVAIRKITMVGTVGGIYFCDSCELNVDLVREAYTLYFGAN
jgi:hypothetical protein